MSIIGSNILAGASGSGVEAYAIEQSLRFDGSSYLYRTNSGTGNRNTYTFSFWVKRAALGDNHTIWSADGESSSQQTSGHDIRFVNGSAYATNDELIFSSYIRPLRATTGVQRDPSAWAHYVIAVDTTQALLADRIKMWVNGDSTITDEINTGYWPTQNQDTSPNRSGDPVEIGRNTYNSSTQNYGNFYLAEFHYVDGTAYDETSFGEYDNNGVWRPIEVSGLSYGTNGWYMKFDPSATNGIGHDHSGNGNDFTDSGFTTSGTGTDVMSDTPTTNWCTLNPLDNSGTTQSDGNLVTTKAAAGYESIRATFGMSAGKWYWESTRTSGSGNNLVVGIVDNAVITDYFDRAATGYGYRASDGYKTNNNTGSAYGATYAAGDVIGVAFDADNGDLFFYKNGTVQNSGTAAFTGLTAGPYFPAIAVAGGDVNTVNFGQRAFAYTPPTDFLPLNTSNLPAPSIKQGSDYFAPIVGPGDTETAWSETNTAVSVSGGQLTTYDGLANTNYLLGRTDTKYPPIDFIRTLREVELDGYDDWYLGSEYEMEVIYYNLKPTTDLNTTIASSQNNAYAVPQRTALNYTTTDPAQTSVTAFQSGGAQAFDSETATAQIYYTSSAGSTTASNGKSFRDSGSFDAGYRVVNQQKYSEVGITRAIRRVAYTGSEPSLGAAYGGGYYAGLYSLNGDGTATHALIVSDKANGENTGMRALVQQKFSSGLYWIKDRQASDEHKLIDSVRGLTNQLSSNLTDAETTYSDPDNASVAWNWLASGSGSSNTDGSITSTVSANPAAGFSIVKWTGTDTAESIGHGLGVAPNWIIHKFLSASNWSVYTTTTGLNDRLKLNSTDAETSDGGVTAVSSTTFSLSAAYNDDISDHIAYCFAEVEGYSKFGSYTGNNNADGPMCWTGFRPALLITKETSGAGNWNILDSARNPTNELGELLYAEAATTPGTFTLVDFLSNGFKIRRAGSNINDASATYVYMAFAEHPFGGSGVSPVTAR